MFFITFVEYFVAYSCDTTEKYKWQYASLERVTVDHCVEWRW